MYEYINETIDITVCFNNKKIVPISFSWKNKEYIIKEINFVHISYDEKNKYYHFAVSTDTTNYKIKFDPKNIKWTLEEIFFGEGINLYTSLNDKSNNAYRL